MAGVLQESSSTPRVAFERRASRRFAIVRDVRYKVLDSESGRRARTGKTINIGSTGVLFSAEELVTPGKLVELSVNWPAQLNGKCGLQLVVCGWVVRCEGKWVDIEITRYEFRTLGSGALAGLLCA